MSWSSVKLDSVKVGAWNDLFILICNFPEPVQSYYLCSTCLELDGTFTSLDTCINKCSKREEDTLVFSNHPWFQWNINFAIGKSLARDISSFPLNSAFAFSSILFVASTNDVQCRNQAIGLSCMSLLILFQKRNSFPL